jgi:Domain of unknown function (DUF4382)/Carboxypeptidase regulatory-like domain/Bacterial Ig-like domain (group 2)
MPKHIASCLLAAAALAAVGSCYQDDATVNAPQSVQPLITVRLTDAPFPYDSLHGVNIYVVRIEANTAPDTSAGGQWALITEPRKTFDLLALQQGATAILGQGEMPSGQYHAVRMTIDTGQSSITWNDAAQHPAQVNWHGWSTIYALVEYPVDVATQGADIVLDFDIGRSFLFNFYGNYEFDFTPNLRAINSAAAGAIAGVVTDASKQPVPNAQVSVFRTFCCQTADSTTSYLEATGRSDQSGHYTVAFLPPGTYSVTIEEPFMPWLQAVVTPNVQVTGGDTTTLSVVLPSAASGGGAYLRISGPTSVGVGGRVTLFAAVGDSSGHPVANPSVTWTTSNPPVASVTGVGDTASVTGKASGATTITATSGGVSDTLTVQVVGSSAPVATVTVVPATVTAAIGDSLNFRAELRDSTGNLLYDRSVSWFTADSTKIELQTFGGSAFALAWARAVGTAVLRATSEGKSGQATITVH